MRRAFWTIAQILALSLSAMPISLAAGSRILLTGPTSFYVAPSTATPPGNDANPCTAAAPCATPLHVLRMLQSQYDLECNTVTVNVADGIYPVGTHGFSGPFVGACNGVRSVQVIGDLANPDAAWIQPLLGYCFDWEFGASYSVAGFHCDQTKNTSTTAGGQDEANVYQSSAEINFINFGNDGAGNNGWNDMTVVDSDLVIDGCPGTIAGGYTGCGLGLEKSAGWQQQAFMLVDHSYVIFNNNNCVDSSPNYCTPILMTAVPHYQDFFIIIDGGIVNFGAVSYPQGSYVSGAQCSIRANGALFSAGLANGSQLNLVVPGTPNSCATATGGQVS